MKKLLFVLKWIGITLFRIIWGLCEVIGMVMAIGMVSKEIGRDKR